MDSTTLIVLVIILIVIGFLWSYVRSRQMLSRWASENGYTLLEYHFVFFSFSSFYWLSSRGQTVYRFTVANGAGRQKRGMARCGNRFFGLLLYEVAVKWES